MEAGGLGLFMISAGLCATLLWYPGSPLTAAIPDGIDRRDMMGLVMGLTAIEAFYFKHPDGNTLEILAFPPDKGDPK
jgi:hypothetical protein